MRNPITCFIVLQKYRGVSIRSLLSFYTRRWSYPAAIMQDKTLQENIFLLQLLLHQWRKIFSCRIMLSRFDISTMKNFIGFTNTYQEKIFGGINIPLFFVTPLRLYYYPCSYKLDYFSCFLFPL